MFVIPMAGRSTRFFNAGFTVPKYQLQLNGESVFSQVIRSFEAYFTNDLFIFIVRPTYDAPDFVYNEAERIGIKNFRIEILSADTGGQAETIFLGLKNKWFSEEIFIFNIDTIRPNFRKSSIIQSCDGYLEVFKGSGDHWSFVMPGKENNVLKTTEKERISDLCSDGLYYFKEKRFFDDAFSQVKSENKKDYGEFYVAPLYNILIKNNYRILYELVDIREIYFCGTPEEYFILCDSNTKIRY